MAPPEPSGRPTLLLSLLGLCLVAPPETDCLRISSIAIPAAVSNGSQVTLACNYELAPDEQLYSVKWYMDYVEFFRLQPDQEWAGAGRPPPTQLAGGAQGPRRPESHSKREFELEGINLDLAKSNATHVHLKQVTLASEAKYKCEVSADSPTFATISAERQLKVYVLPRQKLAIVDNSPAPAAGPPWAPPGGAAPHHADLGARRQVQSSFVYTLNDQINLTCVAAASRPAARLTWFINDLAVSSSSRWLAGQQLRLAGPASSRRAELTESRLTLAFRLQPSYSFANGSAASLVGEPPGPPTGVQPVRLRCVARLTLDFAAETSVQVSGGKTTIKRRNQQAQQPPPATGGSSQLPAPASLQLSPPPAQLDPDGPGAKPQLQRHQAKHWRAQPNPSADQYPIYRWPRPSQRPANGGQAPEALDQVGADRHQHLGPASHRFGRQNVVVVWTSAQLRAQAEHIEQMLRKSHPNELQQPLIEATAQFEAGDADEPDDDFGLEAEADGGRQPQPATAAGPRPVHADDQLQSDRKAPTVGGSVEVPQPSGTRSVVKDYELNESVQFTCHAQINLPEQELIRSVHLKWLINDKETNATKINSFNGSEFFYQPLNPINAISSRKHDRDQLHSQTNGRLPSAYSSYVTTEVPNSHSNDHLFEHQVIHLNDSYLEPRRQTLTIELTPSLFQLKELNLKCRTIVEQPLIEYESQFIVSVGLNPFSQVEDPTDHHGRPSLASNKSSAFIRHRPNINNTTKPRPNKSNVFKLRQHPSSSASSLIAMSLDDRITIFETRLDLIKLVTFCSSLVVISRSYYLTI